MFGSDLMGEVVGAQNMEAFWNHVQLVALHSESVRLTAAAFSPLHLEAGPFRGY